MEYNTVTAERGQDMHLPIPAAGSCIVRSGKRPVITDRNMVSILLLLWNKGEVTTSELKQINSNYSYVKHAADTLAEYGLLRKRHDGKRHNKYLWSLTD